MNLEEVTCVPQDYFHFLLATLPFLLVPLTLCPPQCLCSEPCGAAEQHWPVVLRQVLVLSMGIVLLCLSELHAPCSLSNKTSI